VPGGKDGPGGNKIPGGQLPLCPYTSRAYEIDHIHGLFAFWICMWLE